MRVERLIDMAEDQLIDPAHERWSISELLQYISDGQREVVILRPEAYTRTLAVTMEPGSTQRLEGRALAFVTAIRTTNSSGQRAARRIDRSALDAMVPNWRAQSPTNEVRGFWHDDRDPRVFYVVPPQDGTALLEVVASFAPDPVEDETDELQIPEIFDTAMFYYMIYRALAREGDEGEQDAMVWYQKFRMAVMGREEAAQRTHPGAMQRRVES